jgi:dipeptidyl aminopeptidase/acylaminoacyl peptidase
MFLIRVVPIMFSSLFLLSACGGGGGGKSSTVSSQIVQPPAVAPVKPSWKDTGSLGNNILVLSGDNADALRYIEKIDANGGITTLTPVLVAGGKIAQFSLSPDGKKIVYIADQETDNTYELYLMNTDGLFNKKISNSKITGDIKSVRWSIDSQYLIYSEEIDLTTQKYYIKKFSDDTSFEISYKSSSNITYEISSIHFNGNGEDYSYLATGTTDSHLITSNLTSNTIKRDYLIEKVLSNGATFSYSGKYIAYELGGLSDAVQYVRDTESGVESVINQTTDFITWWSPKEDKLVTFDFDYLSIYDPALDASQTALDLSDNNTTFVSWNNFWEKNNDYAIFSVRGMIDDLHVVPLNGGTEFQLKKLIGADQAVDTFQVSHAGKLLVLTEDKNLFTLNLDGSDIQNLNGLTNFNNVRKISWSSDSTHAIFMQYDSDRATYLLHKIDLSTGEATNIPTQKTNSCFVLENNSDRQCVSFFDER